MVVADLLLACSVRTRAPTSSCVLSVVANFVPDLSGLVHGYGWLLLHLAPLQSGPPPTEMAWELDCSAGAQPWIDWRRAVFWNKVRARALWSEPTSRSGHSAPPGWACPCQPPWVPPGCFSLEQETGVERARRWLMSLRVTSDEKCGVKRAGFALLCFVLFCFVLFACGFLFWSCRFQYNKLFLFSSEENKNQGESLRIPLVSMTRRITER